MTRSRSLEWAAESAVVATSVFDTAAPAGLLGGGQRRLTR